MTRRRRLILLALLLAGGLPVLGLALLSALSRRPDYLGAVNGRLADCPESPNCVCSQASDPAHRIEPFCFDGPPATALAQLQTVIVAAPGARLVTTDGWYLHAEFTSRLFRFVDDVEFLIDPASGVIHCRSASRVGRSDFGVNRRRLEELRRSFDAARMLTGG